MPEAPLTPERRHATRGLPPPPRAGFVELGVTSCFSFLRGASDAVDLVTQARALGYDALGIADANSMAGVVRLHTEARTLGLRPVIGCRIETVEGLEFLAYPQNRAAYGRLCQLISVGRMAKLDGAWQDKGACDISLTMLAEHAEGTALVLIPPGNLAARFTIAVVSNVVPFVSREGAETRRKEEGDSHEDTKAPRALPMPQASFPPLTQSFADSSKEEGAMPKTQPLRAVVSSCESNSSSLRTSAAMPVLGLANGEIRGRETNLTAPFPELLPHLIQQFSTLHHIAASYLYSGDDIARIAALDALARDNGLAILATNLPLYHAAHRRPLHDVMTAIRHKTTVAAAGHLLQANAERHLKGPEEMQRLFAPWPHALEAARDMADSCAFSLEELRYRRDPSW